MLVEVYDSLYSHISSQTGPGGPYALPPTGVLWTLVAPIPSIRDALGRALKAEKAHIGVIMPTGDRRVEVVRSPYRDDGKLQGGAIRETSFYLTTFVRSGKAWALDGAFLDLPGWLEHVLREFKNPSVHDTVRLEAVRFYGAEGDYLILEATASMRYLSPVSPPPGIPLQGFILSNQYGEWFRVYLNP